MRRYFSNNINNKDILLNHENRLLKLEETFGKVKQNDEMDKIFFENQMYDAYSMFIDIINNAKEEIIIIDNYAGKELLDILKKYNIKIVIVSQNIDEILIKKYNHQYSNVEFIYDNSFHDRFIVIDREMLYISGASFKDLGRKCFGIHRTNDRQILDIFLNHLIKEHKK